MTNVKTESKTTQDQKAGLKDSDLDKAVGGRMGPPANAPVVTQPS